MPRKSEPRMVNRLREVRSATDQMTQQDLAERVGVTRQTIISIEKGAYTPSLALALRIAQTFGQTVESLFWLEE